MKTDEIDNENSEGVNTDNITNLEHKTPDITVSTLVHLLGVPTKDEFNILDKKIDLVFNKLDSLTSKLNMLASDLSTSSLNSTLERIDEQLLSIKDKIN
ncbi:MAG: hypothetical protein LBE20_05855 [Deltaproteobacteria bacterium]|jgi:hypothetical protein|nr:hypothetical protein [Deltaproteobacteria bacterium]